MDGKNELKLDKDDPVTILAMLTKLGCINEEDIINAAKAGQLDKEQMNAVINAIKMKGNKITAIQNLIEKGS